MADERDRTIQGPPPDRFDPSERSDRTLQTDAPPETSAAALPSAEGSAPELTVPGQTPVMTLRGTAPPPRDLSRAVRNTLAPAAAPPPESMKLPDGALFIAGIRYEDGTPSWVTDPWSGERIAPVILADVPRADDAAQASVRAFEQSKRLASYQRRRLLKEITRRLVEEREDFAQLITRESGKPKTLARFEVDRAIVIFGLAAEEAGRIGGEVIPLDVTEQTAAYRGHWTRVPRGPVLAITPFDCPLSLVAHKVAPALACGASVVLKPAMQTPLTALKLAEIVRASGGPDDILQVLPCSNEVTEHLARHDAFKVLSFTGSDAVGWHLKSRAGKKHVLLELGGNAACIVNDDATNLAQIAAVVCASAFNFAGQVSSKTQRLYVHWAIVERFLSELVPRACSYTPQDPKSGTTAIGPMIDEGSAVRIERWIEDAKAAGAKPLAYGKREGNRMTGTVLRFENDGKGLAVVEEEAFGPVLTVHTFETFGDALRMANATRYGLTAGLFTDSIARSREAFDTLDVGALVVNDVPSVRIDAMPHGGRRDSGLGREGVRYAIEELTDRKLLVSRG